MYSKKLLAVISSATLAAGCGHFDQSKQSAPEVDHWSAPVEGAPLYHLRDDAGLNEELYRPASQPATRSPADEQHAAKEAKYHQQRSRNEAEASLAVRKDELHQSFRQQAEAKLIAPIMPEQIPAPPIMPGREGYDEIVENRFKDVALSPLSTFGLDVDTASYSNVRRWLTQGSVPPASAVRIEEIVNYFDYDYPSSNNGHPVSVTTELGLCPWNPDHRLAVVGVRADQIHADEAPANRLTFLIDTSGSMHSANKLPFLKRSFTALVEQLRPQDQVAIVTYAGSAGLVLPPTSAKRKGEIYAALNRLRSGGSTAGGAGIQLAYKTAAEQFGINANNRVLIATDGDFNVGQSSDGELVRMIEERRDQGIFLTVMGFGQGNYQDAKMQKIADHGNGVHYYIDSDMEAKRVFTDKLTSTLVTVAKDAKIQIEWNPERVAGYRLVGYENRMLASEDFADDKKDAGDLGAGHTVTAIYEIIPRGLNEHVPGSPLRYQSTKASNSNDSEIGWLKFRYKEPLASTSKLFEKPIQIPANWQPQKPSHNFQWAVAAAEFGMLLRNSENAGNASWEGLQKRLSDMPANYRSTPVRREFVRLVQSSAGLYQQDVAAWSPHDQ